MSKKENNKKEKSQLTPEEIELKSFEDLKEFALELGFRGVTGLKNTLWAHIDEVRKFEKRIKNLEKTLGDTVKELVLEKANLLSAVSEFKTISNLLFKAMEKVNNSLLKTSKSFKKEEKEESKD